MDAGEDTDTAVGLALIGGQRVWADATQPPTPIERSTAMVELTALVIVVALVWAMHAARWPVPTGVATAVPALGTVGALWIAYGPVLLALGERREARLWPSVVTRSAAAVALVAALIVNAPAWAIASWPLGIIAGADVALGAWSLGVDIRPLGWYGGFLRSWLHAGAIGALLAVTWSFDGEGVPRYALASFGTLHVLALVTCVVAGGLDWLRRSFDTDTERHDRALAAELHNRNSHWLHDNVAAQVRTIGLRIQTETLSSVEIVAMLDDLDHELRVRQLDEVLSSGTAHLAEIIQPSLRLAQGHGITVTDVPTFEQASLAVSEVAGRLCARAVSVLTVNAIQAGATRLGYRFEVGDRDVEIAVRDDAGGFDPTTIPAGRGLWRLREDLGSDRLSIMPIDGGTQVSIRVPLDEVENQKVSTRWPNS